MCFSRENYNDLVEQEPAMLDEFQMHLGGKEISSCRLAVSKTKEFRDDDHRL